MQKVLVLGAGKSSGYLIDYLKNHVDCKLIVSDIAAKNLEPYQGKIETAVLKPEDHQGRLALIGQSDLVISMLPAMMHPAIAADCLNAGVHMATASYISEELRKMEPEIRSKGLWFMNECGLDPGLDHMSAMRMFDAIRLKGGKITGFHSYCGGLVSPESMDNPWGYKFSWNPRNVILAGQGTAKFMEHGKFKLIPYHRLFNNVKQIKFEDGSTWDAYPNRDSISYKHIYKLEDIQTIIRGTLRYKGYCEAWDVFVQMGITDDSYAYPLTKTTTYQEFASSFLPGNDTDYSARIQKLRPGGFSKEAVERVIWTGLFDNRLIELEQASPAMILQRLLEEKWLLHENDKDLVLMQHIVEYEINEVKHVMTGSLQVRGNNSMQTAMAKTVGLPLAITCKLFLEKKISGSGVLLPIAPQIYNQVLSTLEEEAICFRETEN